MSLRIPLTNDQTLQTEFHEIERRLRKLERSLGSAGDKTTILVQGGGPGASLQAIYDRLTALEQALANLSIPVEAMEDYVEVGPSSAKGAVPDPGTAVAPTGVAQHVLTEDEYWGFPFRGLVQVLSPGDETDPSDSLNALGDLGINGYLSAYDINCRHLATLDGVSLEGDTYQLSSDERGLVRSVTDGTQTQPPYDVVNVLAGLQVGDVTAGDMECFNIHIGGEVQYYDTFWDDLRVEPTARTTGANAPTFEKWIDDSGGTSRGVYLYSFDDAAAGSEKEIFFSAQLPHTYKEGTAIYPHVHWVGNVSDTTATVRWGLEYAWSDIGESYSDSVIIYGAGNIPSADEGTPDPDITAFKHYLTSFGAITPSATQNGISSIFIGRVFRDSANAADTYNAATNKCGLLSIDIHYEVDTPGSRARYVK